MDNEDVGWAESDWETSAENGWADEINAALEDAAGHPSDEPLAGQEDPTFPSATNDAFRDEIQDTAQDQIREAISQAAGPMSDPSTEDLRRMLDDDPLGHCIQGWRSPADSDVVLLDILPVSTASVDDHGRIHIEPDTSSMAERGAAQRETAEHLVSWLNETGAARDAIEQAISGGLERLDVLMRHYDDLVDAAGFDRSDPAVRSCAESIEQLHDKVEQAKDVLRSLSA